MLTILTTLIGSVLSGGATGLLGLFLQRFFDYKGKSQDLELVRINHAHAELLAKMEADANLAIANRNAEAQERVATADAEAREHTADMDAQARADEAAAKALIASYDTDRARYLDADAQKQSRVARWLMALVDVVRGLIRPVLTAWLVWISWEMFGWAEQLATEYGKVLTADQVHALILQIVTTLLYLATTAVVWWFGSRPAQPGKGK